MTTIRRLYVYVVCFISLQAVAAAGNALIGGLLRQFTRSDAPDALFFTLQLAILIVGLPIFIGHWLWALLLIRRDPLERDAFSYRLYLYANQAVFVAYIAWAINEAVHGLADTVTALTRASPNVTGPLAVVFGSALTVAGMGALWFYHDRLARDRRLAHTGADRALHQLYHLGFAAVGLALAAVAVGGLLAFGLNRLFGERANSAPELLGALAAGAPLWAFHELRRARDTHLQDQTARVLRWLYATTFSAIGVVAAVSGLAGLLQWLYAVLRDRSFEAGPPLGLALLITGLALAVYHDLAVRRVTDDSLRPLRWLYALLVAGLSLFLAVIGLQAGLQWVVAGFDSANADLPESAALFLPAALAWAYHQWVFQRTGAALGLAEPVTAGFRSSGRFLRRLYLYGFSGLGVAYTALGLVGIQEQLFSGFRGERSIAFSMALSWLLVGVPLWLYFWRWAGRLFHSDVPDERQSDLRKVYLYAVIYTAVNAVIITAALLLNGLLRRVLGLPTEGRLGLPLAIILAAAALWAYHAWVLRRDLTRAGGTSLTPSLQRLYWYLVAALGLVAFVVGLAGDLSVVVRWLAAGLRADPDLLADAARFTAAWLSGLPVWLLAWVPAQRAARQPGAAGAGDRRSTLRRLYLYAFALAAVVTALFSAIAVVYQLLNAVFGLFEGGSAFSDVAQSFGFAVISTAVWLYHAWVLRGDGRHSQADRAADERATAAAQAATAQKQSAEWAGLPVVVVDDGDGTFGQKVLSALQRDLPYVTLIPVGLTPVAAAALNQPLPADVAATLAGASVIIAPSGAMGTGSPVAASAAPKIIVPASAPDLHWVGLAPAGTHAPGIQIARTVESLLQSLPRPAAPPAPALSLEQPVAPSAAEDPADNPPAAPELAPPDTAAELHSVSLGLIHVSLR